MRILITGAKGQVGSALTTILLSQNHDVMALDRKQLDLTAPEQIEKILGNERPNVIINCAGYTQVDQAEKEPELVFAVNCDGVLNLATSCKRYDIPLIHLSTDYVFDGNSRIPYDVKAQPNAINVYGKSKQQAEQLLQQTWHKHIILRSSWIFSQYGENFVKKMLKLGQERESLSVVSDQVGCPTPAALLANRLVQIATSPVLTYGIHHFCGSPAVSWYQFAESIFHYAKQISTLKLKELNPVSSDQYPSAAKRPRYSVLDTHDFERCEWQEALKKLITNELNHESV